MELNFTFSVLCLMDHMVLWVSFSVNWFHIHLALNVTLYANSTIQGNIRGKNSNYDHWGQTRLKVWYLLQLAFLSYVVWHVLLRIEPYTRLKVWCWWLLGFECYILWHLLLYAIISIIYEHAKENFYVSLFCHLPLPFVLSFPPFSIYRFIV